MDDIQVLVNIFGCLTQNDENIRVPAEKKLIELLEKMCYTVIANRKEGNLDET